MRSVGIGIVVLTTACSGQVGELPERPADEVVWEEGTYLAPEARLQRLTQSQYVRSVEAIIGGGFRLENRGANDTFPPEGFAFSDEGARDVTTDAVDVSRYTSGAQEVVDALSEAGRLESFVGCEMATASCQQSFLWNFLLRTFRRSPTEAELERYGELIEIATLEGLAVEDGFLAVVEAALLSPNFLYRTELGDAAPGSFERTLSDFELASRLAFFLTDRTPDDALLEAAAAGTLQQDDGLAGQVDRLLATEAADEAIRRHYREWLALDNMRNVVKDPATFGEQSPRLGEWLSAELNYRVDREVIEGDGSIVDLLQSRDTILNETLAGIYGVPGIEGDELVTYRFGADALYNGLVTSAGFLALAATPVRTSAVRRGLFIQRRLLCGSIPPPPPDVDFVVEPPRPGAITQRDRLAEHSDNPACASCHQRMDPMGLPLENYDALGRWRLEDRAAIDGEVVTAPIDASGEVDGQAIEGGLELGEALANSDTVHRCSVEMVYRRGFGVEVRREQDVWVDEMTERYRETGFSFRSLLRIVALSPSFRTFRSPAGGN